MAVSELTEYIRNLWESTPTDEKARNHLRLIFETLDDNVHSALVAELGPQVYREICNEITPNPIGVTMDTAADAAVVSSDTST